MPAMRESLCCSKCKSKKLWRIEKFRQFFQDSPGGLPLPIAISYRDRGFFRSVTATRTFDMFMCARCGFSELWANEIGELRSNPEEGVHFIDGGGTDAPYR